MVRDVFVDRLSLQKFGLEANVLSERVLALGAGIDASRPSTLIVHVAMLAPALFVVVDIPGLGELVVLQIGESRPRDACELSRVLC